MNGKWMPFLLAVALVVGLPRLLYGVLLISNLTDGTKESTATSTEKEDTMSIRVLTENGFIDMKLEEYLVGADISKEEVCVSGKVITSKAPGTAVPFALKLIEVLVSESYAEHIRREIVFQQG